mmetsp:Transcript_13607/g.33437  ORF Transcript_13607/g.33437 Transcript_13607/m.33437 type:complete len:204 (+) Transcript_13607:2754-3365(+)
MILVRARSPAKNTTNTTFSMRSPLAGSCTRPTGVVRRNMLPRVARNSSRSKPDSRSALTRPATKPSRPALAWSTNAAPPPSRSRASPSSGELKSCEGAGTTAELAGSASLAACARAASKNWPARSSRTCSSSSSACDLCRRSLFELTSSTSRSMSSSLASSSSTLMVRSQVGCCAIFNPAFSTCSVKNRSLRAISSQRLTWLA